MNRQNFKKVFTIVLVLALVASVILPLFTSAQTTDDSNPLVPCGGPGQKACGYYDLLRLVNNLIDWVIKISIPISAGIFAWAGIQYMMTGVMDKKAQAKKMLMNTFWGFVFILSAWIIVSLVINTLLNPEYRADVDDTINLTKPTN